MRLSLSRVIRSFGGSSGPRGGADVPEPSGSCPTPPDRARDLTPDEVGSPPVVVPPRLPGTFNHKAKGPSNWSGGTDGSPSSAASGGEG